MDETDFFKLQQRNLDRKVASHQGTVQQKHNYVINMSTQTHSLMLQSINKLSSHPNELQSIVRQSITDHYLRMHRQTIKILDRLQAQNKESLYSLGDAVVSNPFEQIEERKTEIEEEEVKSSEV